MKLSAVVEFHGFTRSVEVEGDAFPPTLHIRLGQERKPGDDPARDARLVEFVYDADAAVYRCGGCVFCEKLGLAVYLVTGALSPRLESVREELVQLRHRIEGRFTREWLAETVNQMRDTVRELNERLDELPKKRRLRKK